MVTTRSAAVYADFLLPHLTANTLLVDIGCGSGELSLELAASVDQVIAVDAEATEIEEARRRAERHRVTNIDFLVGDAYALELPAEHVDVVFAHSVLEALDHPSAALEEMKRVLRPGGLVAVASVEYDGLILSGPHAQLTRRFYDIREQLWQLDGADPYLGRRLRGLLNECGFVDVVASTKAIAYGTEDAVREFGLGRAEDCLDEWYVDMALQHQLATEDDLSAMRQAWLDWSQSQASYAAFAWCRALGRRPGES